MFEVFVFVFLAYEGVLPALHQQDLLCLGMFCVGKKIGSMRVFCMYTSVKARHFVPAHACVGKKRGFIIVFG